MAYNPGILDTNIISRGARESKIDLSTPTNIYTSLQANKRANIASRAQQKLSELTLSNAEKKARRRDRIQELRLNHLNEKNQINTKTYVPALVAEGFNDEAEKVFNLYTKAEENQRNKLKEQAKFQSEMDWKKGKWAKAILSASNPVDAFMVGREDAVKNKIKLSQGLLDYMPIGEEIADGGLDPKVKAELEYLSEKAISPKGPMSLEDKLLLMRERYGEKKSLLKTGSEIKTSQPLTEAEKSKERISKRGTRVKEKQLDIAEKKEDRAAEKWELDRKTALQKHRKIKANFQSQINKFDRFINKARKVAESPNLKYTTGKGRFHPSYGKNIPLVDNRGKDLQSDIDVLLGMQTLETMAELKRLSPTGSTGFGALSAPELKILQDAATAIGNEEVSPLKKRAIILEAIDVIEKYQDNMESFELENADLLNLEKTDDDLLNDGIDEL